MPMAYSRIITRFLDFDHHLMLRISHDKVQKSSNLALDRHSDITMTQSHYGVTGGGGAICY